MNHAGTAIQIAKSIMAVLMTTGVCATALAHDPFEEFRFYEHPGMLVDSQRHRTPDLEAAHVISLSSELQANYSDAEREEIYTYGPWLTDDGISVNAQVLIRTIQEARVHGLNPEAYELSRILLAVDLLSHLDDSLDADDAQEKTDAAVLRFQLGELLDTNFIKLTEHLAQGVVDGRDIQSRLYRKAPSVNAFNLLVSVSSADISVSQALGSVIPKHAEYKRLNATDIGSRR